MFRTVAKVSAALCILCTATSCNDAITTSTEEGIELQANITGSPGDRAAIQHIVETFDQAWTAGDYVTYAGQYAHAEDWVGPTGRIITDPAAILGLYQTLFTGIFANTTRVSTIRSLVFLTGTLAVLDIDARTTGFTTLPPGVVPWQPGVTRALEKNILQKRNGEWRIIRHQPTSVAPGLP